MLKMVVRVNIQNDATLMHFWVSVKANSLLHIKVSNSISEHTVWISIDRIQGNNQVSYTLSRKTLLEFFLKVTVKDDMYHLKPCNMDIFLEEILRCAQKSHWTLWCEVQNSHDSCTDMYWCYRPTLWSFTSTNFWNTQFNQKVYLFFKWDCSLSFSRALALYAGK